MLWNMALLIELALVVLSLYLSNVQHRNKNVVILAKFSSMAALEVVILTTSSAASDENLVKMMAFLSAQPVMKF